MSIARKYPRQKPPANIGILGNRVWTSRRAALALAPLAVLVLLSGGCTATSACVIDVDRTNFGAVVLRSDKPVLVDFYKEGCPACAPLEPTFDRLCKDYAGRATIARFMVYTSTLGVPAPEIKKQYEISFTPTVLLFHNGAVVQRWGVEYAAGPYRKALDEVLDRPAAGPTGAGPVK